jgi:O-antigen/teichoic acid export membrane protein
VSARILANAAFRSVADIGSKIASLALYVVLAREVGDTQFGVYSFALAFAGLTTTLGGLGQDSIVIREVARDRAAVHDYFANTMALRLVLALPALLLALAVATGFGMDGQTRLVALLLGLGLTADLLISTCFAIFQAWERVEFLAVVLIAQRWLTAIVGIAALLAGAGIEAVAAIYFGGAMLGFTLAVALVRRQIVKPRLRIDTSRWWPLLRAALPVGVASLSITILARIDTAMLAAFEPDRVVGHYAAAYRILESTLFLGWSVTAALHPVLSRLTPDSEPPLGRVYESGVKLLVALVLFPAVTALVLAEPLVRILYGAEYADAAPAVRLLAPAMLLAAVSYLAGHLLIARDRQNRMALVYGVIVVQNVGANLILIPILSLEGAALNTTLSELLVVVFLTITGIQIAGRLDFRRVLAGPLLAGGAAAAAMALLDGFPLVALLAGGVAYLLVLLTFERHVYPDDAARVVAFVQRR